MGAFNLLLGLVCSALTVFVGWLTTGLMIEHPLVTLCTGLFWFTLIWLATRKNRSRRHEQHQRAMAHERTLRSQRATHCQRLREARTAIRTAGELERARFRGIEPIDLDAGLDWNAEF